MYSDKEDHGFLQNRDCLGRDTTGQCIGYLDRHHQQLCHWSATISPLSYSTWRRGEAESILRRVNRKLAEFKNSLRKFLHSAFHSDLLRWQSSLAISQRHKQPLCSACLTSASNVVGEKDMQCAVCKQSVANFKLVFLPGERWTLLVLALAEDGYTCSTSPGSLTAYYDHENSWWWRLGQRVRVWRLVDETLDSSLSKVSHVLSLQSMHLKCLIVFSLG